MIPTEEMVRVAAIAVRQARNGCITPPENGTEYDEQLARAALSAALAAMWQPRPIEEYHEDMGDVLWWKLPITEAPYVGSPRDTGREVLISTQAYIATVSSSADHVRPYDGCINQRVMIGGWPDGYYTHWTPLPAPTQLSTRMGSEKTAEG
jgi:hypothetical protein